MTKYKHTITFESEDPDAMVISAQYGCNDRTPAEFTYGWNREAITLTVRGPRTIQLESEEIPLKAEDLSFSRSPVVRLTDDEGNTALAYKTGSDGWKILTFTGAEFQQAYIQPWVTNSYINQFALEFVRNLKDDLR
jgi:hypothetical protein